MKVEDYKKITPEQQRDLENIKKTPEHQVGFDELQKQFEQEIEKELQDFQNEDGKVKSIIEDVELENVDTVNSVKNELQIGEKLNELNHEAKSLKIKNEIIISKEFSEKSFWGDLESVEEKVQKIKELFNSLDLSELEREDLETERRGWNVTNNIINIRNFERNIIERIHNPEKTKWSMGDIPNFQELISQKAFQDIILLFTEIQPIILANYYANKKFNTLIQERPEFIESQEIRSLYKHKIQEGIENCNLFQGYYTKKPLINSNAQKEKVDFFNTKKGITWESYEPEEVSIDDFGRNLNKNKEKKKRVRIPDEDSNLILNLERFEYDAEVLNILNEEEKQEMQKVLFNTLKKNIYSGYMSEWIFSEEVYRVAEKLGAAKEQVDEKVLEGFKTMFINGQHPENGTDSEFSDPYNTFTTLIQNPESREVLFQEMYQQMQKTVDDQHDFEKYQQNLDFFRATQQEKDEFTNRFLDFSQNNGYYLNDKLSFVFGRSWTNESDLFFSKDQRLQAFSSLSDEQKVSLLIKDRGFSHLKDLSFTEKDFMNLLHSLVTRDSYMLHSKESLDQFCNDIHTVFPEISLEPKKVLIHELVKQNESLEYIQKILSSGGYEFAPKDIIDAFSNPEEFVRNQIKGADHGKLNALQEFRDNPNTPDLPILPEELFQEIKLKLLNDQYSSFEKIKKDIEFIPKSEQLKIFSDVELQNYFVEEYKKSFKRRDSFNESDTFSYLIGKSKDREHGEQLAFQDLVNEKNPNSIGKFLLTLEKIHPGSPVIKLVKDFIKVNIIEWIKNQTFPYFLEHRIFDFVDTSAERHYTLKNLSNFLRYPETRLIILDDETINTYVNLKKYIESVMPVEFFKTTDFVKQLQKISLFEHLKDYPDDMWSERVNIIHGEKLARKKNIETALNFSFNQEKLPVFLKEKILLFKEKYGKKGEKLIPLAVVAYGVENEEIFLKKIEQIEKILDLYHPENIPTDCKVTMGIEYEVGSSIGRQYSLKSFNKYQEDMGTISNIADIKKGSDALWEIATRPTENPYLLITEIKLLQEAEMLDFNFTEYKNAARGFHMSLGGESGLNPYAGNMNFLQNILTMSGYTGLLIGREVNSTKGIHLKSLEDAGISQTGDRVEFKGMGGDSFEQFERTIITSHNVAIVTQLEQKYNQQQPETEQERQILAVYQKLKQSVESAVQLHNRSFLDMEFNGEYFDENDEYRESNVDTTTGRKKTYFGSENPDFEEEQKKYVIQESIFSPLTVETVNGLTRSNNLFIFKTPILPTEYFAIPGILKDEYRGNSGIFLETMKSEKGDDIPGKPQDSLFERNGEMRDGYYVLQGTSQEMITHKIQILINEFNKKMNDLINNPNPNLLVRKESRYEYF